MYTSTTRIPLTNPHLALALLTLNHTVTPQNTLSEKSGNQQITWFVDSGLEEAQRLLHAHGHPDPAKNLATTSPNHLFLAALYGIEAAQTLREWLADPTAAYPAYIRTRGLLWRTVPARSVPAAADSLPLILPTLQPTFSLHDIPNAAGLLTVGFPCYPRLIPPGKGQPAGIAFPAESLSFPGLRAHHLRPAEPGAIRTEFPPGYPPGEHPFEYAALAAANFEEIAVPLTAAKKRQNIFFTGHGSAGALVSRSLLESSDSSFRDRLRTHLS